MQSANIKAIENSTQADNGMQLQKLPVMKTIKEMVELTGFSYAHLRNLCLENKIVHVRAGKKYFINYERFADYLNGVSAC